MQEASVTAFADSSASRRGCAFGFYFYSCCIPGDATTVASLAPPYVAGAPLVRSSLAISVRYSLLVRWAVGAGWLAGLVGCSLRSSWHTFLFLSLSLSPSPCSPEKPPSSLSCLLTSLFHIYMPRIPTVVSEAVPPGDRNTERQTDKRTERRTVRVCFRPSLLTGVRPCSLHLGWAAAPLGCVPFGEE